MKKLIKFLVIVLVTSAQANNIKAQSKANIIEQVRESVVWIHAFNIPFDLGNATSYRTGTGYVVGEDSLIITNHHVIDKVNGLLVYSSDASRPFYATVLWSDSILDLAVIKAYDCHIKPLQFAQLDSIKQGDETLILGFPGEGYKIENLKVSWGLISSNTADSTIQTTAPINSGNSGGPALNLKGEVIGTVFAKVVGLSNEGIGFIRNAKYASEALTYAKSELNKPRKYFGTSKFEAYKKICDAAVIAWNAEKLSDVNLKDNKLEESKALILEAIDEDPDFGEAYYYLASYFLYKALVFCQNNRDLEANTKFDNFLTALNTAQQKKPSLVFKDDLLKTIQDAVKEKKFDCEFWRDFINANTAATTNYENRLEDFYNYLITGETPTLLQSVIRPVNNQSNSSSTPISYISTPKVEEEKKSSLWFVDYDKWSPVRLSFFWISKFDDFNKNYGFGFSNVGYTKSDKIIFFKNQYTFSLMQYMEKEATDEFNERYLIFSYNLGIQAKVFQDLRFNPSPYLTVGWNPVNYHYEFHADYLTEPEKFDKWYWTNGAFNIGIDFDIWVSDYFSIALSYEYTDFFANYFKTLYNEESGVFLNYQTLKIGIIF